MLSPYLAMLFLALFDKNYFCFVRIKVILLYVNGNLITG